MAPSAEKTQDTDEHPAVTKFREYLRIKSVQPDPDYAGTTAFLRREVEQSLGLLDTFRVVELVKGKPICLATWEGTDPSAPALLLNSHTDVVPIFPESWRHDAFAGFKDEKGDIYGRGTQDMKSVTIQHLEAVKRLKSAGKKFKRTIHFW